MHPVEPELVIFLAVVQMAMGGAVGFAIGVRSVLRGSFLVERFVRAQERSVEIQATTWAHMNANRTRIAEAQERSAIAGAEFNDLVAAQRQSVDPTKGGA